MSNGQATPELEYYHLTYPQLVAIIGEAGAREKVQMYESLRQQNLQYTNYVIHNCKLLSTYANPAPNLLEHLVSVFYATTGKKNRKGEEIVGIENTFSKKDLTVRQVADLIKSDTFAPVTEELRLIDRSTLEGGKANKKFKSSKFCYVTWSGSFSYRNDKSQIRHSGLICIDVDHVGPALGEIQSIINADPATVLSFISPNGDGLKVIYEMDPGRHTQEIYYRALTAYVANLCGIPSGKIDPHCKDVSRACFLPSDPTLFINPSLL